MKPITHPLAIAKLEAEAAAHEASLAESMVKLDSEMATTRAWRNADCPLYTDPTPLPAPALGMRVWTVGGGDGETWLREPVTINYVRPGAAWSDYVKFVDEIALITNYCKGDIVLWERQ